MEKRFFYNQDKNELFLFECSHSEFFYNKNRTIFSSVKFDDIIRGIITEDKIYLRVFYPYDDIENLSFVELLEKSEKILLYHLPELEKELKVQGYYQAISLNATNDLLKDELKTCYV